MASASNEQELDDVVLVLMDPSAVEENFSEEEMSISALQIHGWDIPWILCHRIVKVQANRSRLSQESSYFHSLFSGSFSESSLQHVLIHWSIESILNVLRFIYGCQLNITSTDFLLLLEATLFFGVDSLLLECETWFQKITAGFGLSRHHISANAIIEIWNFGVEHGVSSILGMCKGYLARNFAWAVSTCSFVNIPYVLLHSAVEHPELTIESEMQLCEALLGWLTHNVEFGDCSSINSKNNYYNILEKVRIFLLPLEFAAGTRRSFPIFADDIINAIFFLMNNHSSSLLRAIQEDGCSKNPRIRLTEYSEKIVLCGCPQVTMAILFLGILSNDLDSTHQANILHTLIDIDYKNGDYSNIIEKAANISSFETVREVDISKCPRLRFPAVVTWLHVAFPSLRILKASHYLNFKFENLYSLLRKCPLTVEVDLTVDISPVISTKVSVLSVNVEEYKLPGAVRNKSLNGQSSLPAVCEFISTKPVLSNISKLTLEGRSDIIDLDLLKISSLSPSLSYLNIKGCIMVTDLGISKLLAKCPKIQSLITSYTAFGRNSILTLNSNNLFPAGVGVHGYLSAIASRLQQLHIDGCKDVDSNSLTQLMSQICVMKTLSLKESLLDDDALYSLASSSLETLDVSDTLVSMQVLNYVIKRNPNMRCLRVIGCRKLHQSGCDDLTYTQGTGFEDFLYELGKRCMLEELTLGWGFCSQPLERLQPAFRKLKAISVGLGAEVDRHLLCLFPKICPLLESVILRFQVISDDIVRSILESLNYLQVLCLSCCLGHLTSLSFRNPKLTLRSLKLDWVTPWMTNNDLTILTQNCPNVFELSLSGCRLLDSDSQEIISSGWSGLKSVHLEECGKLTCKGVLSFFNCKAIEELLLRHNGQGVARDFIMDAASKLPLLRKLSLDLCDAVDGGFNSPSHSERLYLSTVKICRCKAQRCAFELERVGAFKSVHKETIVLEWTSSELRTTVVKERL